MSKYSGSIWPAEPVAAQAAHAAAGLSASPSRNALRGYARLLRGVLDDLPYAVIVVEHDGELALWNDAFEALLPTPAAGWLHHDLASVIQALGRNIVDPHDFELALRVALESPADADEIEVTLLDGGALAVGVAPLRLRDGVHIICVRDASGELRARR